MAVYITDGSASSPWRGSPRTTKPLREVLSREEVDLLESVMPTERDKLIIRIFGDCGLRIHELTMLAPADITVRATGVPAGVGEGRQVAYGPFAAAGPPASGSPHCITPD